MRPPCDRPFLRCVRQPEKSRPFFAAQGRGGAGDGLRKGFPMQGKPLRCGVYARGDCDRSVAQQLADCQAQLKLISPMGQEAPPEVYVDRASPGRRPAWQCLMDDVAGGRMDLIVVADLSRISRSHARLANLLSFWKREGVAVISVA